MSPHRPQVSTKLPVLNSLLGAADSILIGGAMMFTFVKVTCSHMPELPLLPACDAGDAAR